MDFAEAWMQKGGSWVANTGNGYGMDDSVDLSELLMLHFQEELGAPDPISGEDQDVPLGWALVRAKQRYFNWVGPVSFGLYREKILIEATLYGLPMLKADLPYSVPVPEHEPLDCSSPAAVCTDTRLADGPILAKERRTEPHEGGDLVVQDLELSTGLEVQETPNGAYLTWHGRSAAVPGRPIQPQAAIPIGLQDAPPARNAILLSATYETFEGWNPAISRPITDTQRPEPEYNQPGWWPPTLFTINTLFTQEGPKEQIVLNPGQFSLPGTQRAYSDWEIIDIHSDTEDREWPTIWWTSSVSDSSGIDFTVDAEDPSGINRVVISYTDGAGRWDSLQLSHDPDDNLFKGRLNITNGTGIQYFVQAVDNAGNVAQYTDKQGYFPAGELPPPPPAPTLSPTPTSTLSPTPTATGTPAVSPTPTATATPPSDQGALYLPLVSNRSGSARATTENGDGKQPTLPSSYLMVGNRKR
ncbi:MAG: hypothetical protein M3220_20745 [Chloroflexota bacterium]|nr:hypothetical protein [Chloroflexota bacterium]